MPNVTISTPTIGLTAYFSFKEPMNNVVRNKFNIASDKIKLTVVSIIAMKDTIRNDLRDPYSDIYLPANISEAEYKKDLNDDIPIVSFKFKDHKKVDKYIRVPLNYINDLNDITFTEYINKFILIDMNRLPKEIDLTLFFEELKDFIETRYGIEPNIKEVSLGTPEEVDNAEHQIRETIRNNMVTVHKTLHVKFDEITLKHDQLLERLRILGISLD